MEREHGVYAHLHVLLRTKIYYITKNTALYISSSKLDFELAVKC